MKYDIPIPPVICQRMCHSFQLCALCALRAFSSTNKQMNDKANNRHKSDHVNGIRITLLNCITTPAVAKNMCIESEVRYAMLCEIFVVENQVNTLHRLSRSFRTNLSIYQESATHCQCPNIGNQPGSCLLRL